MYFSKDLLSYFDREDYGKLFEVLCTSQNNLLLYDLLFHTDRGLWQSSSDHVDQGIASTIQDRTSSFWSSIGNQNPIENPDFEQSLMYSTPEPSLITKVIVKPFCAQYQEGWPYFSAGEIVIKIGFTPHDFHEEFVLKCEDLPDAKHFTLPHVALGRFILVTFRKPYQRQLTDDLYYYAIERVHIIGMELPCFLINASWEGLEPSFLENMMRNFLQFSLDRGYDPHIDWALKENDDVRQQIPAPTERDLQPVTIPQTNQVGIMGVVQSAFSVIGLSSNQNENEDVVETKEQGPIEKILIRYTLSEWKRSGLQCESVKLWNSLINSAKKRKS